MLTTNLTIPTHGSKFLTTQNSKSRTRGGFSADLQSSLWFFNHYSPHFYLRSKSRHCKTLLAVPKGSTCAERLQNPEMLRTSGTSSAARRACGTGGPLRPVMVSRTPSIPEGPSQSSPETALQSDKGPGQGLIKSRVEDNSHNVYACCFIAEVL